MSSKRWLPDDKVSPEELMRRKSRRVERALKQRKQAENRLWSAECCINWYPGGSGWTACHTCGKMLVWKCSKVSEKWRANHEQTEAGGAEPDVPGEGRDEWEVGEDEVPLGGAEEGCELSEEDYLERMREMLL